MKKPQPALSFNAKNERMKYAYKKHITRVLGRDKKTLIAILKHIRHLEVLMDFKGFEAFNNTIADNYISNLLNNGKSLSFIQDNIRAVKDFLKWLERQKGYRSKLNYNHIDYLNLTNNQKKTAKAQSYKASYTFEQIIKTIRHMPQNTLKERRDKAMVSLQALCGFRISELRTAKIKNIIQDEGSYFVSVNPKDMQVKYAKSRNATFLNLPDDILQNVITWRDTLIELGHSVKDPLFPKIPSRFNQLNLLESNLTNQQIKSNSTMITVFKKAFEAAGYEYLRPHSFRHTIARFAERQKDPAYFNAISQALGHKSIVTTYQSYGHLSDYEQIERIKQIKVE